ncbi:MAG TPA: ROK family protein [Pyrinomonadaceae bacterium]|nr:ROK family protein [Pyrinomonadaceae bacterium]
MAASNQSTNNFIGFDLSGATMRAALVSEDGRVTERREAPLERSAVVEQVARTVVELRDVAPHIASVGVGVPGLVNRQTDRVLVSTDLPSVVRADIHAELMNATGLRVEIENDANAAAYGEYKVGAGRGSRDMFYITIGTGIGGAIILDGKLWTGASGFAGEFGHITIDTEGIECMCGNTGCLETVASAPNIVRRTHERLYRDNTSSLSRLAMNKEFTAADIAREARNGDDFALMMIERTGKYIGVAVASVINLLNLERIVLGGGVMEAGDLILNPIIREAGRRSFQPCFEATQIVAATLGADAVSTGAALLARDASQTASS